MKPLSKLHTEAIEKAKTEQAKVKAAALAMIETPMDLIKAVLLKHEEAVIEVMGEMYKQQQADTALLRQALAQLEINRTNFRKGPSKSICKMLAGGNDDIITTLRERLGETK